MRRATAWSLLTLAALIAGGVWTGCGSDSGDETSVGSRGTATTVGVGWVVADVGGGGATTVSLEHDGKIAAAGPLPSGLFVMRAQPDGAVDAGFGTGGTMRADFGQHFVALGWVDLNVRADDAWLAVVWVADRQTQHPGLTAFARFLRDGRPDPGFGIQGVVQTATDFGNVGHEALGAFAFQPDRRVVGAGYSGPQVAGDFAVARYLEDGGLDPSFGTDGKVITDIANGSQDSAIAVAIQRDVKIVAVGHYGDAEGFALTRYLPDGRLDASFGVGGIVRTRFGAPAVPYGVAIQPDDRIVAVGRRDRGFEVSDFALTRYLPNGQLDPSFGKDGLVTTSFGVRTPASASAVVLQGDGKIVAVGETDPFGSGDGADVAVARYLPDGDLDPSFGYNGKVLAGFRANFDDRPHALVIDADGKIVIAGETSRRGTDTGGSVALLRLMPDGAADATFGR